MFAFTLQVAKSIHFNTNRRYFNKQCEQNGENDESCVDIDPVSVVNDFEKGINTVTDHGSNVNSMLVFTSCI